jgi:hypothetical protein
MKELSVKGHGVRMAVIACFVQGLLSADARDVYVTQGGNDANPARARSH